MNTRTLAANTATILHAAIDLTLILVLGSIAALLDKYDQLRKGVKNQCPKTGDRT